MKINDISQQKYESNYNLGEISLELVQDADFFEQCSRIQWPAWDEPPLECVPPHNLQAAQKIGGIVIAAYINNNSRSFRKMNPEKEVIAFSYSTPGKIINGDGKIGDDYLYMHLIATHPDIRKRVSGIGNTVLMATISEAERRGYNHIKWTYDPLQTENANLYIKKIGAICNTYEAQAYNLDGKDKGVPNDRFFVDLYLNAEPKTVKDNFVEKILFNKELNSNQNLCNIVNETLFNEKTNFRYNQEIDFNLDTDKIYLEIPFNHQEMKNYELLMCEKNSISRYETGIATQWILDTREIFLNYFNKGYYVADFITNFDKERFNNSYLDLSQIRCFYIFEKNR